jgi:hypothetical protein
MGLPLVLMPKPVSEVLPPYDKKLVPIEDGTDEIGPCKTCGAEVGQQCSDEHGTEWASRVHEGRQL